jgi:hypothetical protein
MKKFLLGAVVSVLFVGCGTGEPEELVEEYPAISESTSEMPLLRLCTGSCPLTPSHEPLGKLCTLDRQACNDGILLCYYRCIDIEPRPY